MRELTIAGQRIADDTPCFLLAEIGNNHGGSVETAHQMVTAAAKAGASAVKFQCRDNATLYSPALRAQPYENPHSFGPTYGAHRDALELPEVDLAAIARTASLPVLATAFDEVSADRICRLGLPAIKLASGSLTDLALLVYVSSLGKPIILSTGGSTMFDVDVAVDIIRRKTDQLAILHCTAAYPVLNFGELNLRVIETLRGRYPDLVIGWSGHDSGIAMSVSAYTLGARIIEKHFTLNRAMKGTDHAFSLEPAGMKKLARDLGRCHEALGDGIKRVYDSEVAPIAKMRRVYLNGQWQIGTTAEREAANAHR